MPHLHRFYHPATPPLAGEISLDRDEAHHAMRVLRARLGDEVELFNGQGHAWQGAIASLARNEVLVSIGGERFVPRPAPEVTLAQAWLHRDKPIDELVRQATVLGASRICFFRAEHSEKQPRIAEKWGRLAVEACKQCGRFWLPEFDVATSLADVLEAAAGQQIVLASMEGPHQPLANLSRERPVTYIVGPEGDFSHEEQTRAREAGVLSISLGQYTLRSETAAITGLTLIQHHLGHLG